MPATSLRFARKNGSSPYILSDIIAAERNQNNKTLLNLQTSPDTGSFQLGRLVQGDIIGVNSPNIGTDSVVLNKHDHYLGQPLTLACRNLRGVDNSTFL